MELGLAIFIVTLPFLSTISQSFRFQIESGQTKCMDDDIKIKSMTVGQYSVINPNEGHPLPKHHKISVALYSDKENRYHYAELVESGHFALKVEEDGKHMLCFLAVDHEPKVNITVELNWRSGVTVKGWDDVATKDSLDTVEEELKKMEETVTLIHEEMLDLREREREMQELIKYTNSIMGYLGLVSLFICLSVAGLQLWHLKSFFEKKKMI